MNCKKSLREENGKKSKQVQSLLHLNSKMKLLKG